MAPRAPLHPKPAAASRRVPGRRRRRDRLARTGRRRPHGAVRRAATHPRRGLRLRPIVLRRLRARGAHRTESHDVHHARHAPRPVAPHRRRGRHSRARARRVQPLAPERRAPVHERRRSPLPVRRRGADRDARGRQPPPARERRRLSSRPLPRRGLDHRPHSRRRLVRRPAQPRREHDRPGRPRHPRRARLRRKGSLDHRHRRRAHRPARLVADVEGACRPQVPPPRRPGRPPRAVERVEPRRNGPGLRQPRRLGQRSVRAGHDARARAARSPSAGGSRARSISRCPAAAGRSTASASTTRRSSRAA